MSVKVNQKEIDAVLALSSERRYRYFVKVVADRQEAWGLFSEGWALAKTDMNETVFPMWPAVEYASLCAAKEWSGYAPKSFTLDGLLNDLLPRLKRDGVLPGVFYTPQDKGVTPSVEQLVSDLRKELENYC